MTTKKDASGTPDYVGVVDSGPFPPIKRYDLGTHFYNSLSVPEIVESPQGKYVAYEDYLRALELVKRREIVIGMLEDDIDAIGAGGVSGAIGLDKRTIVERT